MVGAIVAVVVVATRTITSNNKTGNSMSEHMVHLLHVATREPLQWADKACGSTCMHTSANAQLQTDLDNLAMQMSNGSAARGARDLAGCKAMQARVHS